MSVRAAELVDETGEWSSREVDEEAFQVVRLGRRCAELVRRLGASVPTLKFGGLKVDSVVGHSQVLGRACNGWSAFARFGAE